MSATKLTFIWFFDMSLNETSFVCFQVPQLIKAWSFVHWLSWDIYERKQFSKWSANHLLVKLVIVSTSLQTHYVNSWDTKKCSMLSDSFVHNTQKPGPINPRLTKIYQVEIFLSIRNQHKLFILKDKFHFHNHVCHHFTPSSHLETSIAS